MAIVHIDRPWPTDLAIAQHEAVGPGDEWLRGAQAAIGGSVTWDAARFDQAPELLVLALTGIGVDHVDLDEATKRGVLVTNTPDGPTVSTAEHALALILAAAKEIPRAQGRLRNGTGDYARLNRGIELDGKTIGLFGYGRISRRLASYCRALGMNVIATDPFVEGDPGDGTTIVSFDELLSNSDVLSLHAPLSSASAGVFDEAAFAACRDGLVFVNCARGGLVDHHALRGAIHSGKVSNAALDVTDPEPLDAEHPLLQRDDVIVTPHIASATIEGRRRMLDMAAANVVVALQDERPPNLFNKEAWSD